jgi:hypothetical protein
LIPFNALQALRVSENTVKANFGELLNCKVG